MNTSCWVYEVVTMDNHVMLGNEGWQMPFKVSVSTPVIAVDNAAWLKAPL